MKLDAVTVALPSRRLSNEDLLALIGEHSNGTFAGDLGAALAQVATLLRHAGARSRRWLLDDESPLALMTQAVDQALEEAGCGKDEIDLLIYTGVDRGYVDPANAYFVAHAAGMDAVHCFDVLDACNGWSRALQLAEALFQAGAYRRILLVNGEFPMFPGGPVYPDLFALRASDEIRYLFAAFTLGEAATATILSPDPGRAWEFRFSSRTSLADLCTVPLTGFRRYAPSAKHAGRDEPVRLTAFSGEMFAAARREVPALLEELTASMDDVALIVPHAASFDAWEEGRKELAIEAPIYNIFPRCGNIAAASVPAGISLAAREGRVRRGDRLLCVTASAGMSFAAYSFVY
jgi:3-oxoacyl-[acyl-carrier-protein] synthase III